MEYNYLAGWRITPRKRCQLTMLSAWRDPAIGNADARAFRAREPLA